MTPRSLTRTLSVCLLLLAATLARAEWKQVYFEDFNTIAPNTETGVSSLSQWERASALGVVYDGKTQEAGRFLIPRHSWSAFNQGPIFNLDLAATPHDRIKVEFDLYTFGDWRGFQRATGGPLHRLMFFDSKANPRFAFDTTFASNPAYRQGWPGTNQAANKARTGGRPALLDQSGRFKDAICWPIKF